MNDGGQLGLPDHGDAYDRDTAQKPGRRRVGWSATGTAPQETTRQGLATAAIRQLQADTPISSRRLGALLSSDGFGSRVGRCSGGHPVYVDVWERTLRVRSGMA